MATLRNAYTLCIFIILSLATNSTMASHSSSAIKGAYWPSWATDFPPSAIKTSLFTHIYYAFLLPNTVTYKFVVDNSTALMLVNFTSTLHSRKPPVRTLFSTGGANANSTLFSQMASSSSSRKNFIYSTIEVARKFGFDGIDLDWEFPQTPNDMGNLGILLYEWRAAVKAEASSTGRPQLLLSAATYFSVDFFLAEVYRKYPVTSVGKNLDWINAMCYDYHGSWDVSTTGAQAALFDPKSNVTTSYGLGSWIRAGFPRKKLIMGLPLYGRTWTLKDPTLHGIGAPAVAAGPGIEGQMPYIDVEMFNVQNNATVVYDVSTVSTYSVAGTSWIGYDDVRSTALKIRYARALRLRGYFFWAVNGDQNWKISKRGNNFRRKVYIISFIIFVLLIIS